MEYLIDEKGKWQKKNIFKALVEPSAKYLQQLEQEKLNSLLKPIFKKPNVSDLEIQLANFILDISERLERLEGGNV